MQPQRHKTPQPPARISPHQTGNEFSDWFATDFEKLNIVTTFNLVYIAAIMVDAGIGYAITLDHLADTSENSHLCFRPLAPKLESGLNIIWKKYQVFSKAANLFLRYLQDMIPLIEPLDPNIQGSGSSR